MQVHGYTSSGYIWVTIDDVNMYIPDDPSNPDRQMIAEWEAEGNTITPFVPTAPVEAPLTLHDIASVRLLVDQDTWEVTGVERSNGISGGMLIDTDLVWVFFNEDQPDTTYCVSPSEGVTKHEEYIEVSRPNLSDIKLLIQRVQ